MDHRTKPSGNIKYTAAYNGHKIVFGFDRDFVFVNCVCYEDGSDVPCEDVIQCMYEIHRIDPKVTMVDGNGPIYGNVIVFDSEGRPIVKVADDVICSAYRKCVCDDNYPPAAFIISDSVSKARRQVDSSGCFTPLKKKYLLFGEYCCSCKTCGAKYSLSGWRYPGWKRITPYEWPDK